MLMIQFFSRIDKRMAGLAAAVSLLALSQLPLAQAGEHVAPLPPGAITVEDTHYQPVAPGSTAPQLPAASRHPSAEDMVDAAKRNIGKIDRDLRKDAPAASQPAPAAAAAPSRQQILEKALAGPVAPKETPKPGATTMEEITRPDGQRVTKVTGPNGTYCVTQISVGNTKGEDIIQKGAVSRTTSCGAPF
ncbi:hypothetical protein SAMN04515617_10513 [Collimonas sp. OK242]|uniref:hypothetical protein n=1 Tax=Collimonas sp. OK242 TaxID=1798195 RepID=UPI00089A6A72|nr:hypothetical protein [Collimonas sp. OK242]SDX58334.1 hypothetical protein SAMN04515617_10513 [Collimonas sp. OK242]